MRLRSLGFFVLTSMLLLGADLPQSSVRVHVTPATQELSPLQILGWRAGISFEKGPAAVLKNVSDRTITEFVLATRATVPRECPGVNQSTDHWDISAGQRPEKVTLSPGQTATSSENLLSPDYLLTNVTELGSRDLEVRFYVVAVSFADGTSWNAANLREAIKQDISRACAGRAAFWANPMPDVQLHFSNSQLHPSKAPSLQEVSKEWTLQCQTNGVTADCQ